jgi:hypothetical protein
MDTATLRELFRLYARLGWVDEARESARTALAISPGDPEWSAEAARAEEGFARALDSDATDNSSVMIGLLNRIRETWSEGNPSEAVAAWRELAGRPGAEAGLEYAHTYLSRTDWTVKWFASKVDPIAERAAWELRETGSDGVQITNVRTLSFPYLYRGPKDLLLNSMLTEKGPGGKNFGMFAHADIPLAAGKWRFHVIGGGGVRVKVDGTVVLDSWTTGAPAERTGDYTQGKSGPAQVSVESFVAEGVEGFQFWLEPVF